MTLACHQPILKNGLGTPVNKINQSASGRRLVMGNVSSRGLTHRQTVLESSHTGPHVFHDVPEAVPSALSSSELKVQLLWPRLSPAKDARRKAAFAREHGSLHDTSGHQNASIVLNVSHNTF